MGMGNEIKEFIAGMGAGRKMFDTTDEDYKRARTELIGEQIKTMRDPETARGRKLLNDARAGAIRNAGDPEISRGRKIYNDMRSWLLDQYRKQDAAGSVDPGAAFDASAAGKAAAPAALKPQSALPVDTSEGNPQMAADDTSDMGDDEEQPAQMAAQGGTIERLTTDGQRQRQDYAEPDDKDADKIARGAGALPVPEYLGAIERMHKSRSKNYAEGGAVEDDGDDDDVSMPDDNTDDPSEGALPTSASPTAGRVPGGSMGGFSREAATDAVFAGQLYNMKKFGLNTPSGVPTPDRGGRVRAYAMGAGGVDPKLFDHVSKVVDPEGKLPEGERNMKAIGSIWQYYIEKREFPKAQAAAGEMVQYFRGASQRYAALSAAAAKGGQTDQAAQLLAKAYANIPDGREFRIVSDEKQGPGIADRGGGISAEYVDESGKVIHKGLLTPEEIAQGAMKLANPATFDQLMEMAGKPVKAGKPAKEPKGPGVSKLADREKALKMVGGEEGDTEGAPAPGADSAKAVAAAVLQANDIDPSRANKIAKVLLDPRVATRVQANQDGSYIAQFDGGQQIKIPQMAFLEMMDARGKGVDKAKTDDLATSERAANRDREDTAIKKVRDKTYTPERVSAARSPGKFMARKQREESPDKPELATADNE